MYMYPTHQVVVVVVLDVYMTFSLFITYSIIQLTFDDVSYYDDCLILVTVVL